LGIAHRSISVEFEPDMRHRTLHKPLILSIKTLGDWIRAKRIAQSLTPGHLAAKMGITHAMICSWENNTTHPIKEQMQDLARVFGEFPPLRIVN
jgi:DNA-binding transcriptional regulator YiaG